MAVVEGGNQLHGLAEQHAVAEHVARHVADAHHGDRRGVGVDAEHVEVATDALPCPPGRDAHPLVVVARRPSGGEGVAQPEAVLRGEVVGDVAEGGGALVGGHDEVGVVAVVAHDLCRGHHHASDDVVGDVEHAPARTSSSSPSPPPGARPRSAGGCFTTKPPLAPTGTITAFFTIWAFMRPSTSVRKSSMRSDHRRPPRATRPPRRCTPSTRGEYTQISNMGRGSGRSGTLAGSSLKLSHGRWRPSGPSR